MGTLVEASVIVHAPFSMEEDKSDLEMASSPTKDADRDSVIDIHPAEREHSFIKQNGHIIQNGRVPLTIDTSLEEESKLDETPKSSPSDTDSGFEKCLNSPTGSPVSSKSDSANSSCSGAASPDSVVIVCESTKETDKKECVENVERDSVKAKSKNGSPPKGILKNRNIISEGFVNLAFDASDEETGGQQSRPNSLLAHEMALSVNNLGDKTNSQDVVDARLSDTQRITAKLQQPLDVRARRKSQHKLYWVLLGFVVLLIVAAAIIIPILWLTQDKEDSQSGSSSNSTVIPSKARL